MERSTVEYQIRLIEPSDNAEIYQIIRSVFEELDIAKPGTAYFDSYLPYLYETYTTSLSAYFVAEINGEIVGGAGIFPTEGLEKDTCELVKMYLSNKARGLGIGKQLMNVCLEKAKELNYRKVYLETLPELKTALKMYEKFGLKFINESLGNTGHHSCSIRMIKEI